MLKLVLIATPTPGFGELIQQTLEETDRYQAVLVNNSTEAIERAQANHFSLGILDAELDDIPLPELVGILLKLSPDLRVVAIPPNNDPADSSLLDLPILDTLTKPFYLPDLITTVDLALNPQSTEEARLPVRNVQPTSQVVKEKGTPVWLQDVTRAAQYLTSLSLESSALAALIVREGQLWAYAGQLSQEAAQELAGNVVGYLDLEQNPSKKSDLARFTTLEATHSEYLLYATSLGGKMVLALAFDTETPFNQIRTQASQLAKALASSPPPSIKLDEQVREGITENHEATPPFILEQANEEDGLDYIPLPPIKPLLEDVPPPRPHAAMPSRREAVSDRDVSRAVSPNLPPTPIPVFPQGSHSNEAAYQLASNEPGLVQPVNFRLDAEQISNDDPLGETRPHVFVQPRDGEKMNLRPTSPSMCDLSYASVLVPRIPKHRLVGDLERLLPEWIAQLCLAYGWQLASLSVNPTHIEWVTRVSPSTSPGYLMRILRQHTSKRIFSEFPALAGENPSGDFWAPGYLIMSGSQPPPMHIVQDFIEQTRLHQGAYKPDSQSWK